MIFHLKRILFILSIFCCLSSLFAQSDSLSQQDIKRELEAIKLIRLKDSIKIAILMNEIKELVHTTTQSPTPTNTSDSLATIEKKQEIESLREKIRGKPIVFQKDTLFYLYTSYGPYDIDTRVKYIEDKIQTLYDDPFFTPDSIQLKPLGEYLNIMYKKNSIAGITMVDAMWENTTQEDLASRYANAIKSTIVKYKEQNSLKSVMIRLGELLLVLLIAFVLVWGINRLFKFLKKSSYQLRTPLLNRYPYQELRAYQEKKDGKSTT